MDLDLKCLPWVCAVCLQNATQPGFRLAGLKQRERQETCPKNIFPLMPLQTLVLVQTQQ